MRVKELRVYELAMDLVEDVRSIVNKFNYYQKDNVANQKW